jgi:precorrin-6x reductase
MICDLVGSTALSARLDPENMRAVIDAVTPLATTASSRNAALAAEVTDHHHPGRDAKPPQFKSA